MHHYSDEELADGIKRSDNHIIQIVYENYFSSLNKFVLNNCVPIDEAHDIFQEAMIVVWRNMVSEKDFRLTCSLFTYFCSVYRRQWLYYYRRKGSKIFRPYDFQVVNDEVQLIKGNFVCTDDMDLEEFILQKERSALYHKYFEKLKDDCKKIISMFLSESTMEEIAKAMEFKSERVARHRKYQCMDELKRRIKSDRSFKELMSASAGAEIVL